MIVYVLEFDNGKFYVGITKRDFITRFGEHLLLSRNPKTKIQFALRKYYPENVKIHIADGYADWDTLCEYEHLEIKRYNSFHSGYNSTEGGDGVIGYKHTEEDKNLMSRSRKGRTPWNKGIPMSQEQKQKQSSKMKGRSPPNKGTGIQIHGTLSSYTNYKCRCSECKETMKNYSKNHK